MKKSKKELAFLRDLSVTKDWTEPFTSFSDKHLVLPQKGKYLYLNAGTLSHALELREKLDKKVELICVCEDANLQKIAEAKAKVIKANIQFKKLSELKSESFDAVLADLTFLKPDKLNLTLDEIIYLTKKDGSVSFFMPTAGSFGEIFSYLWETFLDVNLIEKAGEIERLLTEIPTVSGSEEMALSAGLKIIGSETSKEIFDYESGEQFVNSTLLADFFFPVWLDFLSEKERNSAIKKLAQIIDEDLENLSFQFTVKATFLSGNKS